MEIELSAKNVNVEPDDVKGWVKVKLDDLDLGQLYEVIDGFPSKTFTELIFEVGVEKFLDAIGPDLAKTRFVLVEADDGFVRSQLDRLKKIEADIEAAAGELMVPVPQPGTDAARVMIANRLLKSEVERLTAELKLVEKVRDGERDAKADDPCPKCGSFTCPKCGYEHSRGPVHGSEIFYCLSCGHAGPKQDAKTRVSVTWKFGNGMVSTCDENGQQIPDLQGKYTHDLHRKITEASDDSTEWKGFGPLKETEGEFIVELEDEVWLDNVENGDPGRTLVKRYAEVFSTRKAANTALVRAREMRPFDGARVVDITGEKCDECGGKRQIFIPQEEREPGEPFVIPCPKCTGTWEAYHDKKDSS